MSGDGTGPPKAGQLGSGARRAAVRRVRARYYRADLQVDALHGVGFQAVARGGWRGPVRRSRLEALWDAREHG